jgi:glutathione S-transferase
LGLDYETETYFLGDPRMRTPEYRAVHPMGRVPALEDGGTHLMESGAIIQYLLARYGNGRLQPPVEGADFAPYLQWFHYCEGMIMAPINQIVVETILLPADRRSDVHAKRATKLLGQMLASVDTHMAGRDYLVSDFSGADIMTGHSVVMARRLGADFSQFDALTAYADRIEARPAFQRAENLYGVASER